MVKRGPPLWCPLCFSHRDHPLSGGCRSLPPPKPHPSPKPQIFQGGGDRILGGGREKGPSGPKDAQYGSFLTPREVNSCFVATKGGVWGAGSGLGWVWGVSEIGCQCRSGRCGSGLYLVSEQNLLVFVSYTSETLVKLTPCRVASKVNECTPNPCTWVVGTLNKNSRYSYLTHNCAYGGQAKQT